MDWAERGPASWWGAFSFKRRTGGFAGREVRGTRKRTLRAASGRLRRLGGPGSPPHGAGLEACVTKTVRLLGEMAIRVLCALLFCGLACAAPRIDRVEPPNWWVPHTYNPVQ